MDELLGRISSAELTEWVEFFRLEPWGPEVEGWQAGMIASTIANVNRGKGVKPFKPADFMLALAERKPDTSASLQAFRALAARPSRG